MKIFVILVNYHDCRDVFGVLHEKIDQYEQIKINLGKIELPDLKEFDIKKMLYSDIWNMISLKNYQKVIRIIANIICKSLQIIQSVDRKSANIIVDIKYGNSAVRPDNKLIFDNLCDYLEPAGYVTCIMKWH